MDWIDKLEKRLGGLTLSNLPIIIIFGQIAVWLLVYSKVYPAETLLLIPYKVLQGEVWRLFTFLFVPELGWGPIFLLLGWYVFWFTSQGLIAQWGAFRYNLFIWMGLLFTILISFVSPFNWYTNFYIELSVLLAFATLYPNFEFRLYFLLPVKVKWIALISLGIPLINFLNGPWSVRLVIFASLGNYMLFFGRDLYRTLYYRKRRIDHQKDTQAAAAEAFHTCASCGATDKTNPERTFRYKEGEGVCDVCLAKEPDAES
ncbi:hypothetical protein F7C95_05725 [Opitutia bacterium ISCC 51]|nr:hypothetical protein F7C95_05725 [Opitutae bacterium ISCC 51]QXD29463.1 hypothetical protein GA003_05695 [Opitutae bacterium ISCC 52]